ncbi:hypothetical protein I79_011611 [Cricetulus griseus]|uniref:Uncharacterized protein n=1 Tax=Cricetulus griseus TaxID=10029 RepID=G3HLM1_CRIGR|nr:hypothetical protein I79_011611 [Cricetulus griseus]
MANTKCRKEVVSSQKKPAPQEASMNGRMCTDWTAMQISMQKTGHREGPSQKAL